MFIRVVQLALFFAIMIPFAMGVKWSVGFLDQHELDIATGIIIGMAISLALQSWDERLRRRAGTRTKTDL
jgi:hypothetical protein